MALTSISLFFSDGNDENLAEGNRRHKKKCPYDDEHEKMIPIKTLDKRDLLEGNRHLKVLESIRNQASHTVCLEVKKDGKI